jgi:hypothetical protein
MSDADRRAAAIALAMDVVAVLLFVVIGRRSHDEDGNVVSATLAVAAPFLIGLGVGWLIARAWRHPRALPTGIVVWVCTVVIGLVLRNLVFDRGTAASFIVVATIVLAIFLLGWRALAGMFARTATP